MITRQDFQNTLEQIYNYGNYYSLYKVQEALLINNENFLLEVRQCRLNCLDRIDYYLNEYDNAPTEEAKMAVVGSVTGVL